MSSDRLWSLIRTPSLRSSQRLNASADDVIARKPGHAPVLNDSVLRYHIFEPAHSTAGVHRELELPAGCRLFVKSYLLAHCMS